MATIPNGWIEGQIGDFITLQRGVDITQKEMVIGNVPVISSSGITGYHNQAIAEGPGVITGRKGLLGKVYYINQPYWPHDTTLWVKDFKGNHARYVYYFLTRLDFLDLDVGSSNPTLNRNHVHPIRAAFPPLDEQREIAAILGSLDDKIELNRRMNETLEATARAIFQSWFVDFDPVRAKAEGRQPEGMDAETAALFPDTFEESELGLIPSGWGVGTLGEISEKPQYGYTASASDEAIGPKFLRIMDINKSPWIEWETVPFCTIAEKDYAKYALLAGDIIIARMADPGHGALIEELVEAVFASYLIRFRPRDATYGRYIQYWLRSPQYWQIVDGLKTGTTRPSLNAQVLSGFRLILPPESIARTFSLVIDSLRAKVVSNNAETRMLSETRDVLLPKLISGEIRVGQAEEWIGGVLPLETFVNDEVIPRE